MKKVIITIAIIICCFAFVACGINGKYCQYYLSSVRSKDMNPIIVQIRSNDIYKTYYYSKDGELKEKEPQKFKKDKEEDNNYILDSGSTFYIWNKYLFYPYTKSEELYENNVEKWYRFYGGSLGYAVKLYSDGTFEDNEDNEGKWVKKGNEIRLTKSDDKDYTILLLIYDDYLYLNPSVKGNYK